MTLHRICAVNLLTMTLAACATAGPEAPPARVVAAAGNAAGGEPAAADSKRHGPEIVAFAGVQPGAKVVDLIPGGGYWTRLFATSVGPQGHVYGIWPLEYTKVDGEDVAPYQKLVQSPAYANVSVLTQPAAALAVPEPVDLVFTAQNYHDYLDKFMGPVAPATLNDAAFAALKPGGIYLIIDHAADAGSGHRDTDTLHRIDPAAVKAEVLAAGFQFAGASPLLANPSDDHRKEVFDPAIRGRTDQFIYKFRKP